MLHVRKTLSRKEREQYQKWRDDHLKSIPKLTPVQQKAEDQAYWEQKMRDGLARSKLRSDNRSIPSLPPQLPEAPIVQQELSEEFKQREAAAQQLIREKQFRVAPVFNKGGYQYYSDDMVESMLSGRNKRR